MNANAKVKHVKIDGVVYDYYRFKVSITDDTSVIRWASTAENAILSVAKQFGWKVRFAYPNNPDHECEARAEGGWDHALKHKNYYHLEAHQTDF